MLTKRDTEVEGRSVCQQGSRPTTANNCKGFLTDITYEATGDLNKSHLSLAAKSGETRG